MINVSINQITFQELNRYGLLVRDNMRHTHILHSCLKCMEWFIMQNDTDAFHFQVFHFLVTKFNIRLASMLLFIAEKEQIFNRED